MWRVEELAEEGPALWVGVASSREGRAETKGPAGEELPDRPLEQLTPARLEGLPLKSGSSLFRAAHRTGTSRCRGDAEIKPCPSHSDIPGIRAAAVIKPSDYPGIPLTLLFSLLI